MAIQKSMLALAVLGGSLALINSTSAYASLGITPPANEEVWITTDADAQHIMTQHGATVYTSVTGNKHSIVAKINQKELAKLSSHMHEETHRCGGYMVHEDKAR